IRKISEWLIVAGSGAARAASPDDMSSPAGPNSPTTTIGFSPRYLSVHSSSFAPSLLTTARYSGPSTEAVRCGGRGAGVLVVGGGVGAGAADGLCVFGVGVGAGVAGVCCSWGGDGVCRGGGKNAC